jgi:DNA-binding CsgD family transcriptional regulator
MEHFSSVVLKLYAIAQLKGGVAFMDGALASLAELVGFSAATLTRHNQRAPDDLEYVHEYVQDAGINNRCLPRSDGLRHAALHGMRCGHQRPLTFSLHDETGYGQQALVVASDTPQSLPPYCMILRRFNDCSFDRYQIALVKEWWRHFRIAHALSLHHALCRHRAAERQRAMAVVTTDGLIEYADPGFTALLRSEWELGDTAMFPSALWSALNTCGEVCGRRVLLRLYSSSGELICEARSAPAVNCLGPKERFVATRVAQGDDYKRIARQLGTSPHTVRSQISCIYRKLDVHNKADLARLILGSLGATSPLAGSSNSDVVAHREQLAITGQDRMSRGYRQGLDTSRRERS